MKLPIAALRVVADTSPERIDTAARVWAAATAARDGLPEPASPALARPPIASMLEGIPDALLLTALEADSPLGFAAISLYETLGWRFDGPTRAHARTAKIELHYTLDLV